MTQRQIDAAYFRNRKLRNYYARRLWVKYKLYRDSFQYVPALARVHAYFSVVSLRGGRKNLFVDNIYHTYNARKNL